MLRLRNYLLPQLRNRGGFVQFQRSASQATAEAKQEPHHDEGERHETLPRGFFKTMGYFWSAIALFIVQDRYFTRRDENGVPQLHPITRWILYYRKTEKERMDEMRALLLETRRAGEVTVFQRMESQRPVKDPVYDPRVMTQKDWAYPPTAMDVHHVDLEGVKWRKGYGEDEDAVEVLKQKNLSASK